MNAIFFSEYGVTQFISVFLYLQSSLLNFKCFHFKGNIFVFTKQYKKIFYLCYKKYKKFLRKQSKKKKKNVRYKIQYRAQKLTNINKKA